MDVKYRFNGFTVDPVRRLLFGPDGQPIALKPRVSTTLLYLVEHRGELLEKQALLDAIWPHVVVEENNLNQAISTLRRALRRDARRASLHRHGARPRLPVRRPRRNGPCGSGASDCKPAERGYSARGARRPALCPAGAIFGRNRYPSPRRGSGLAGGCHDRGARGRVANLRARSGPGFSYFAGPARARGAHTSYLGNELAPTLSPTGESVAFSRDDEGGNRNLYVARIGGTGSAHRRIPPSPIAFLPGRRTEHISLSFGKQTRTPST